METKIFEWSPKYEVGIKEIDDQHKSLFGIINRLNTAFLKNSVGEEIDDIMEKLINYADYHFTTEERYFDDFKYEYKDAHVAAHQRFIDRLKDINEDMDSTSLKMAQNLMSFLQNWITSHIQVEDQKFTYCFRSHGLK